MDSFEGVEMIWNFSFLGYLLSIEENEIFYDVAEMLYFKCLHVLNAIPLCNSVL